MGAALDGRGVARGIDAGDRRRRPDGAVSGSHAKRASGGRRRIRKAVGGGAAPMFASAEAGSKGQGGRRREADELDGRIVSGFRSLSPNYPRGFVACPRITPNPKAAGNTNEWASVGLCQYGQ